MFKTLLKVIAGVLVFALLATAGLVVAAILLVGDSGDALNKPIAVLDLNDENAIHIPASTSTPGSGMTIFCDESGDAGIVVTFWSDKDLPHESMWNYHSDGGSGEVPMSLLAGNKYYAYPDSAFFSAIYASNRPDILTLSPRGRITQLHVIQPEQSNKAGNIVRSCK